MTSDDSVDIIVNGGAGTAAELSAIELIRDYCLRYPQWRLHVAKTGPELVKLAKDAAAGDVQIVVAGGGDGTINAVVNEILDTGKTLGVLPIGTLNHFAKDLGIPLDLNQALQTISEGHTAEVDVGHVNGRAFVNNSSLGLYPSIVNERDKQQRLGWGKWPAFVWASLLVLRRYPLLAARLMAGEGQLTTRTPFVFIGNNRYEMEGLGIGTRERLDSGELSLYVTARTGRLALLRLAWRALLGGLWKEHDFNATMTKEVWIETRRSHLHVATDGEVIRMPPQLHYEILPRALRVIVPAPTTKAAKE